MQQASHTALTRSLQVIVLWTANTERYSSVAEGLNDTADNFMAAIERNEAEVAPSSLYAAACILEGVPFINGAPQNTFVPGLIDMAVTHNVLIGGDDFKSGQTKMKSVLVDFLVRAWGLWQLRCLPPSGGWSACNGRVCCAQLHKVHVKSTFKFCCWPVDRPVQACSWVNFAWHLALTPMLPTLLPTPILPAGGRGHQAHLHRQLQPPGQQRRHEPERPPDLPLQGDQQEQCGG